MAGMTGETARLYIALERDLKRVAREAGGPSVAVRDPRTGILEVRPIQDQYLAEHLGVVLVGRPDGRVERMVMLEHLFLPPDLAPEPSPVVGPHPDEEGPPPTVEHVRWREQEGFAFQEDDDSEIAALDAWQARLTEELEAFDRHTIATEELSPQARLALRDDDAREARAFPTAAPQAVPQAVPPVVQQPEPAAPPESSGSASSASSVAPGGHGGKTPSETLRAVLERASMLEVLDLADCLDVAADALRAVIPVVGVAEDLADQDGPPVQWGMRWYQDTATVVVSVRVVVPKTGRPRTYFAPMPADVFDRGDQAEIEAVVRQKIQQHSGDGSGSGGQRPIQQKPAKPRGPGSSNPPGKKVSKVSNVGRSPYFEGDRLAARP